MDDRRVRGLQFEVVDDVPGLAHEAEALDQVRAGELDSLDDDGPLAERRH